MRLVIFAVLCGVHAALGGAPASGQEAPRVTVKTRRPGEKKVTPPPAPRPAAVPVRVPAASPRRPARREVVRRPAVRPRRAVSPEWRFAASNVAGVTYSVAPRAANARGDRRTGDLILRAEPGDARVFFYVNGGAQLTQTTHAVVKGRRPPERGNLYLLAVAPELGGRAGAFVPVVPGHITTVRFRFLGTPVAAAAE
jgi:hypothetical protein